jgi:hypothetical protein
MNPLISFVTVPLRSEGIIPLGPRILPNRGVIARMREGVARMMVAVSLPEATCENKSVH